ncbi:MAG TPA: AMP-binding protein, partial [Pseudonocardiaceae bacterium]|nr:AMP-binding protein [Pseudonocardiaceae bacterium]
MPELSGVDTTQHVQDLLEQYSAADTSVASQLCDRYPADQPAYTVVEPDLSATTLTYGRLRADSERFAAALFQLGVRPGDRVATLMGKSVEYLVALLGIWRLGAVHVPLFTAFAAPAVAFRLWGSGARIVVCDETQRAKLAPGDDIPADPPWRVVVAGTDAVAEPDLPFAALLAAQQPGFPAAALGGDAPIVHIYTSGTTGRPKGVVVPTRAVAGFQAYLEYAIGIEDDDVYWCAADPGWAYGLYFGIIGSLSVGVHSLLLH